MTIICSCQLFIFLETQDCCRRHAFFIEAMPQRNRVLALTRDSHLLDVWVHSAKPPHIVLLNVFYHPSNPECTQCIWSALDVVSQRIKITSNAKQIQRKSSHDVQRKKYPSCQTQKTIRKSCSLTFWKTNPSHLAALDPLGGFRRAAKHPKWLGNLSPWICGKKNPSHLAALDAPERLQESRQTPRMLRKYLSLNFH